MIIPKEFEERMLEIEEEYAADEEEFHIQADNLMIAILRDLGYSEGTEIFIRNRKWYS